MFFLTDRLKTSVEMAVEKSQQQVSTGHQVGKAVSDAGMEAFLRLLDSKLALPQAAVESQNIKLRLDKGEKKEIPLLIRNRGRGYLSGTIEISKNVPGLELSDHRFSVGGKEELSVNLRVDTEEMVSRRHYYSSLEINTKEEYRGNLLYFYIRDAASAYILVMAS